MAIPKLPKDPLDAHRRRIDPMLGSLETVSGKRPGDVRVRIVRPFAGDFARSKAGNLVASERTIGSQTGWLSGLRRFRTVLIGRPISSLREHGERVGRIKGLAVFASDNISSSAYASEEIMRVLLAAGAGALALTMPITLAIAVVLVIVVTSYQQTIRAYPSGGGSYIVASDNLGPAAGLVAAGALLTDYVLTVAVSIAAGVAALTSIFPGIFDWRVAIGVGFVAILGLGNLRGIRESATLFAIPTYVYLFAIYGLIAFGLWHVVTGTLPAYHAPAAWTNAGVPQALGLLLILRAFASGSVALSGTEAVSNGVPAFHPPEWVHARTVLLMMGFFFGTIFLGVSFLAGQLGIVPDPSEQQTVLNQIAATLVGAGTPYHYFVQISTALILVLAANTAFADFPRLASILGKDRFLPRQFQFRGERLAFTIGIVVLSLLAALLIVAFGGSVTNLIPLYTVGVFAAFTLSQSGMVVHWWRLRSQERGWRWRAALNGAGALVTGLVALIVGAAKFALGAWMILILIPLLVGMMWAINRHYRSVESELDLERISEEEETAPDPIIIVPISRLDRPARAAIAFANSIGHRPYAVHVSNDPAEAAELRKRWPKWAGKTELVIVESPYRALVGPLLSYMDALQAQAPEQPIVVIIGEFVPRHWWEYLLHNQTSLRLKLRLFGRRNTIVANVPYQLAKKTRRASSRSNKRRSRKKG